jgi:hypothetical protein
MKRQNKIIPTVRRKATTLIINFVVLLLPLLPPPFIPSLSLSLLYLFTKTANCEAKTIIAKA